MGRRKKKSSSGGINKKTLANSLLGIFSNHPKKTYNYKQLATLLLVTDSHEKRLISEILNDLKNKDALEEISTGRFKLKSSGGTIIGKVQIVTGGYGFVSSETIKKDIFVSQNNLNHALDGDIVSTLVRNYDEVNSIRLAMQAEESADYALFRLN